MTCQTSLRHHPPPRLGLLNALGASYNYHNASYNYQCRITLHTLHLGHLGANYL